MPAAKAFLMLKKDGREKEKELGTNSCPIVVNGEIPTNCMARVLFTKILTGGKIQGKRPAPTASLNNFTAFPSNKRLSAFGAPANKQALNSNGDNATEHVNTYHSPTETRSSINDPYPQFGWQGAVC